MAAAAAAAAQPVLPDEILEDIFLRLDAAADLARTSAACSSFHRLISARRFLRRFRSLHSPHILGLLDEVPCIPGERFIPIEPPHRSAPAARALARAADFSFSFLPYASLWRARDSRDGRVVLSRRVANADAFDDLVVCDPLHLRYVMIPPIPNDLMTFVPRPRKSFVPFLVPAGDGKDNKLMDEEESSFRVICTVRFENKFMAFFFSSANQKWGLITYHSSTSFVAKPSCSFVANRFYSFGAKRSYAHGCFLWVVDSHRYALMLDTRGMKFSIIDLPPKNIDADQAIIVEAGEGKLGLLTLGGIGHHFCKIWRNNGLGAEGWQHYKMIPLPKDSDGVNCMWFIGDATEPYVTLTALKCVPAHVGVWVQCFVLDINTLLVERICTFYNVHPFITHLYASFPPPLALPSI